MFYENQIEFNNKFLINLSWTVDCSMLMCTGFNLKTLLLFIFYSLTIIFGASF